MDRESSRVNFPCPANLEDIRQAIESNSELKAKFGVWTAQTKYLPNYSSRNILSLSKVLVLRMAIKERKGINYIELSRACWINLKPW